jgi:dCTP deaminase
MNNVFTFIRELKDIPTTIKALEEEVSYLMKLDWLHDISKPSTTPGILCDWEIEELCKGDKPMLRPFHPESIKQVCIASDTNSECHSSIKILSKGLSSAGYDISASAEDVKIFKHIPGEVVDPKNFNPEFLEDAKIKRDHTGVYFILPGNSYALLNSVEYFDLPRNIKGKCDGKSTNSRVGIHINITPLEPGWFGHLTIEISNGSPSDCKVYLEEGIAQIEFSRINNPRTSYADRNGKYNGQPNRVVFAKV